MGLSSFLCSYYNRKIVHFVNTGCFIQFMMNIQKVVEDIFSKPFANRGDRVFPCISRSAVFFLHVMHELPL